VAGLAIARHCLATSRAAFARPNMVSLPPADVGRGTGLEGPSFLSFGTTSVLRTSVELMKGSLRSLPGNLKIAPAGLSESGSGY
jgi:hypothetical protein